MISYLVKEILINKYDVSVILLTMNDMSILSKVHVIRKTLTGTTNFHNLTCNPDHRNRLFIEMTVIVSAKI